MLYNIFDIIRCYTAQSAKNLITEIHTRKSRQDSVRELHRIAESRSCCCSCFCSPTQSYLCGVSFSFYFSDSASVL